MGLAKERRQKSQSVSVEHSTDYGSTLTPSTHIVVTVPVWGPVELRCLQTAISTAGCVGRTVVLESCNEKTMFYLADSTARQIQRRLDSTLHTVLGKQTPATQRKVLACRTSFSLVHRRQWGANSHRA